LIKAAWYYNRLDNAIEEEKSVKRFVFVFACFCFFSSICNAAGELSDENDQNKGTISQQNNQDDCQNGSCNINDHVDHA
jgi:hypothetical protein